MKRLERRLGTVPHPPTLPTSSTFRVSPQSLSILSLRFTCEIMDFFVVEPLQG
jgi:hypothetical protein